MSSTISIDLNSSDFKKTLKGCSNDNKNKDYMTESELEAINFDRIKEKYAGQLGLDKGIVRSTDALLKCNGTGLLYFIEFKNGKLVRNSISKDKIVDDPIKVAEIKEKVRDSLLIYNDITHSNISYTRNNAVFILVYNEQKNDRGNSLNLIHNNIMRRAKKEEIRFQLACFEKIYFKEVHTYTESQFTEFLNHNFIT